ncbi:zinc dependent phospholipase C family protein [Porcipelethomonas sp.]|uniref:zinc dependent phospholipase C family protein n=1 Tax=Porcipelethomonas sp. TaxID=2981675 RepID=UPI003EF4AAB0
METKDHLALAKLIISKNKFIDKSYKKAAFETGCISPDINLLTYAKGHTYSGTIDYVKKTVSGLSEKLHTASDFFELGRAVHFIGDYFTFPHSPNFKGTLKEHVEYEAVLHKYISENSGGNFPDKSLMKFRNKKTVELIDSAHEKYLSLKNSVKTDWAFIRFVCSEVTFALTCKNTVPVTRKTAVRPVYGSI